MVAGFDRYFQIARVRRGRPLRRPPPGEFYSARFRDAFRDQEDVFRRDRAGAARRLRGIWAGAGDAAALPAHHLRRRGAEIRQPTSPICATCCHRRRVEGVRRFEIPRLRRIVGRRRGPGDPPGAASPRSVLPRQDGPCSRNRRWPPTPATSSWKTARWLAGRGPIASNLEPRRSRRSPAIALGAGDVGFSPPGARPRPSALAGAARNPHRP